MGLAQHWKPLGRDEDLDASSCCGLAADKALSLKGEHHLVDRWWRDGEEVLEVSLGGGTCVDLGIGPDEGEVLALFFGEGGSEAGGLWPTN